MVRIPNTKVSLGVVKHSLIKGALLLVCGFNKCNFFFLTLTSILSYCIRITLRPQGHPTTGNRLYTQTGTKSQTQGPVGSNPQPPRLWESVGLSSSSVVKFRRHQRQISSCCQSSCECFFFLFLARHDSRRIRTWDRSPCWVPRTGTTN